MDHKYFSEVMKYLPASVKAEIKPTGGGYYSIIIPFDRYTIDIPDGGGASLFEADGAFVMILTLEINPKKLAEIVTNFYNINFK